jgi:molecular chaperone GrpE
MQSTGEDFDATRHEAITEIQAGPENTGKVIDTIEKGYLLNGNIIRFAKVVVGA